MFDWFSQNSEVILSLCVMLLACMCVFLSFQYEKILRVLSKCQLEICYLNKKLDLYGGLNKEPHDNQ